MMLGVPRMYRGCTERFEYHVWLEKRMRKADSVTTLTSPHSSNPTELHGTTWALSRNAVVSPP